MPLIAQKETIHVQPNMPFQYPSIKGKIILFLLDILDGGIGQRIMLALLDRLDKSSFNDWQGGQKWKMTM